jgi:hypothetical protein
VGTASKAAIADLSHVELDGVMQDNDQGRANSSTENGADG